MPFISLYCLIEMLRVFSTVLNRNDESWHSYLVLDLMGIAFNISLLRMLAVGFF